MLRTLLAGVGVLAIIGVTGVAIQANQYDGKPSKLRVDFAGLDLTTADGVDTLNRRVENAVKRVCRYETIGSMVKWSVDQECRDKAWAAAQPQIAVAIDSARHPGRGFGAPASRAYASFGAEIDQAVVQAFQSGETARWDTGFRHGLVLVSQARALGVTSCRNVSVVHLAHGGWVTDHEGEICLGPDGLLHDTAPSQESAS